MIRIGRTALILGDSLQVMASLAEREGLRGKVQMIYFDPPYGIKFNSNFQWSTTSRDVKDDNVDHITREPVHICAWEKCYCVPLDFPKCIIIRGKYAWTKRKLAVSI